MFRRVSLLVFLVTLAAFTASAQSVHTPEKGSAERKAILDALRIPVERDLKQKIVFVTDTFNVLGTWAFVGGRPTKPDGSDPDLRGTAWEDAEDMFDNNFFGLLRKAGSKWKVTAYALGCTDVCYADWWRRYRAPKAIFPYTE
ncbi:MAG TPA: hypothetical protein VFZ49_03235 [Pyrinomonadaceae bacterium]